ncbi:hypothetical protein V1227_26105 [Lentzea sp. DG1S-22]|uniref:hypothetical protein n=1 Tax=Lentzea sp. DG1S-22 TaxID=3108822 RepID=UPI002E7884CC|nr:hypothetical protein [Lentzea sp. DG1S-22]WVH78529.1 hypothetical protein V1227_26105 [Lentzea sp. DG1S-22]
MLGRHDSEIGELLRFATSMMPREVRSADLLDYLDLEEWELVLDLLGEFDGHTWQTPRYWALLAEAAVQMDQDDAWFQWRCVESIQGLLRVELTLSVDAEPLEARESARCGTSRAGSSAWRRCGSSPSPGWALGNARRPG